ncbi:MAG: hypothetical protein KatS3mg057_1646 [Herpetosiphonaceae bacterium]|nr:MAG: hypothetical protein KatS3mg057_1646 [Herpetosiphonaceae bacterium]
MITALSSALTHPETARWVLLVPQMLAVATLLVLILTLRGRLLAAARRLLISRAARARLGDVDPALIYLPATITATQFLIVCVVASLAILYLISRIGGLFVGILLSGPATALLIWAILWAFEQRYINALDRALPPAVSRLAALLAAGTGPQPALKQVMDDLPPGPLKAEWAFLIERLGTPLRDGTRATAPEIAAALALQTPSARHRGLLTHLEVALSQPQDVLVRRMQAAGNALYAAEQRRSAAATELAQVRYSGLAVGLAGLAMAMYLFVTQRERFEQAYAGAAGLAIGAIVIAALMAPIVAGVVLARADELDY